MLITQSHYEELLIRCSHSLSAIELLKEHRPYLEMVPSLRRSEESLIPIPLPLVQIHRGSAVSQAETPGCPSLTPVSCDLALLMCDPEWKIKTGVEILVFIHRPQEEFSQLLSRWRQAQALLSQDYAWVMPPRHKHIVTDGADKLYPLFIVFAETPKRIKQGLRGAYLPFITQTLELEDDGMIPGAQAAIALEDNIN